MKNIAILGSTGSIGVNALNVVRANPEKYRIMALAAGKNIALLLKQIEEFQPIAVAVLEEVHSVELKTKCPKHAMPEVFFGSQGLVQVATLKGVDTIISAITGAAGLLPTFEAIRAGKDIALANKETMVMAGELVMGEAEKRSVSIIPIDSEHSAILQSLQGHSREDLRYVILTASGGPFRDASREDIRHVMPAQALNHPNWNMGKKVSIDSATMMNKGLEAIEAKWLFDLEMDQIKILIHPQSIVHSMVEYADGSIIAQLGVPDMFVPISYALSCPRHLEDMDHHLDLEQIGALTFEKPDMKKFRCLHLALQAAEMGGTMPAVLNGANEIAVDSFLAGEIGFSEIPALIEKTMAAHHQRPVDSIETILEIDGWVRNTARDLVKNGGFGK